MLGSWLMLFTTKLYSYKDIFNKEKYFIINYPPKEILLNKTFLKRQTSGTPSDNQWQRMSTSGTTSDNEWQRVVQRVTISANFSFFQIRQEPTTKHPKENSLNIEEDLWRRPIELRAETSP